MRQNTAIMILMTLRKPTVLNKKTTVVVTLANSFYVIPDRCLMVGNVVRGCWTMLIRVKSVRVRKTRPRVYAIARTMLLGHGYVWILVYVLYGLGKVGLRCMKVWATVYLGSCGGSAPG